MTLGLLCGQQTAGDHEARKVLHELELVMEVSEHPRENYEQ